MLRDLERRLQRLEAKHAPSLPLCAVVITARDAEDAARQVAEAVAAGRHRPGWPAIIITSPVGSLTEGSHP